MNQENIKLLNIRVHHDQAQPKFNYMTVMTLRCQAFKKNATFSLRLSKILKAKDKISNRNLFQKIK